MNERLTIAGVARDGRPDKIERLNLRLYRALMKAVPDQVEAVFASDYCDIEPQFLGFVDIYARLSEIIPKHWTVVDLGCCYAPQAWYFRNHKRYIGVDSWKVPEMPRFRFPNTEHLLQDIGETAGDYAQRDTSEVFTICSYVPAREATMTAVRSAFRNLFVYYPHGDRHPPLHVEGPPTTTEVEASRFVIGVRPADKDNDD